MNIKADGTARRRKAYGKPLVLLPAIIMGRFKHGTILCRAAQPMTPGDPAGKQSRRDRFSAVQLRGLSSGPPNGH
jgi:hypothetical protein